MKKIAIYLFVALMALALVGCSESQNPPAASEAPKYAASLDVLKAVVDDYGEEEIFAMVGGDSENIVENGPGEFDVAKTEELDFTLGLPQAQADQIDGAASMVHMMNSNTFTGAAYHLAQGADESAFVEAVKKNILSRQWICGIPDKLIVLHVDGGYVITAFGNGELIETFKGKALSVLSGAKVVEEAQIA